MVTNLEAQVYGHALRHGAITSLDAMATALGAPVAEIFIAVTRLVELRLLRADPIIGDRLVPTAAEVAESLLVSPLERAMYQRQGLADQLRERIERITRADSGVRDAIGAIDSVTGAVEIRGLFKLASHACRDELLVLRPSHHDEDLLDELLEPCYAGLDRGVRTRVVCPHRSRAQFASRSKAKKLLEGGAQIRTRGHLPRAAVVFDDALAIVLDLPAPGAQPAARRVRDRGVVRFLIDLFNQLWDDATPFTVAEPGYADTVDDLHQSIARLMAKGLTDEVVARRLGMSVRTCRRHIAALMQNLSSVSRFQAGVHAATRFSIGNSPGERVHRAS